MTELVTIGTGLAMINNLVDLVGKLKGGVSKERPEIVSQFYASLSDIQQRLITAENRESELLSQCRALEEQIAHAKDWQAETTRYVLLSVDGGVVRQQKADHASGDPPHWLCANCFEEQQKSYLQKDPKIVDSWHIWKCPRCSTAVMVDQDVAPGIGKAIEGAQDVKQQVSTPQLTTPETPSSPHPRDD